MSYNQSRPDRSDSQYRRTGRSTGYHQQQQQPHQSSPTAYVGTGAVTDVDFSLSSNRSLKKPQRRHQTRVNPPPVSHPVPNKHSGPYVQSRSQVVVASGVPANSSSGAIPKAPTSQSPTAEAPGDPFKASAFRFASLGPDLMKISAPPNMDKQKRAQVKAWVPKKDLRNKAADKKKEGNSPSTMHLGGPNMPMQPPNVAPSSFQIPMALSMGNSPQIQQQVFFQGLPSHPMHQAQGHGFATPMGAQIHPQLGQVGVGASPHTPPMQVMHKAERKYQVGAVADEEQAKQRQLKGILEKLTPQNFEKLLEQFKSVNIDNAATLIGLVSQIFDKALMEPTFCEMYADLCLHLSGSLPGFNLNWYGKEITFKRLLLNKCQMEFERGEKEEEEANRVPEEGQTEEERLKVRRRRLGNIRLIGELYKRRIMPEKIMHHCIQELLGVYDQVDPHEENIEALCKLVSTIGLVIDHGKAKVLMDKHFEKMKMLSCKQELSSRARFMLVNVIGLRKNKWQKRMKVEGPIPETVGNKDSCVFVKERNESMDINGFHVLSSQVESVRRLFERHPDIAIGFRAKNQLLRNSCMNSLLSLIETLCQPLEDLSNEDLVEADIALAYVKDLGFRVDWLDEKLDQVKEKKKKEVSGFAMLQETEESLLKLKRKCAELEALAEEQKAELSATRTPLSFDDVV
ncbi:eukaryotic translation initiation factor 4G isoform X2 [Raphanus sativus]|uniref:Eukaryotic translation initiation factor 4G isoform X2 n=1 Tax=Raphanus sativus TaxID=3726 RepID=A0A6J0KDI9_RAPSA|nr:eukaryotic translation initiation factor 4G isoform X2 [Raphanus sativus]